MCWLAVLAIANRGVAPAGEQLPHRHRGGHVLLTQAPQLRILEPRLDELAVANAAAFGARALQ
jgi:hypothetical protein